MYKHNQRCQLYNVRFLYDIKHVNTALLVSTVTSLLPIWWKSMPCKTDVNCIHYNNTVVGCACKYVSLPRCVLQCYITININYSVIRVKRQFFIDVPVPSQESDLSCMHLCVRAFFLGVSILPLYTVFLFDFETIPKSVVFFVFLYFSIIITTWI